MEYFQNIQESTWWNVQSSIAIPDLLVVFLKRKTELRELEKTDQA